MNLIMSSRNTHLFLLVIFLSFFGGVSISHADGVAKIGDKVTIEYHGTLSDGTVFDTSKNHDTPLEFELGSGQVISGFDKAVEGMKVGEEKKFTLQPHEAYGDADPNLMHQIARTKLPPTPEPKVGMMLRMGAPDGSTRPGRITEVAKEFVVVDLNHPLAGQELTFAIKLTNISQ